MFSASTETYVAWITWLLLIGFGLAAAAGVLTLTRSRRMRYFQMRREAVLRGWQLVLASVGLLITAGLSAGVGTPLLRLAVPPTPSPAPTRPPTATPVPPSATASATPSPRPTATHTAGPTPTATDTSTPTITPTPKLPVEFITPVAGATVTPPAQAIAASVRFSMRDDCSVPTGQDYFDQLPKQIYAHFFYDNWLPGVQWSAVWLRDSAVLFAETHLWDGSTGGCGFSNYDNLKGWWPEGQYEVQIFVGDRWLASGAFQVQRSSPTPSTTPSRTPRTPTLTPLPSDTPTPATPATPTPTRTPRATPSQPGPTASATPRPTRTPTPTPSRTPSQTATVFPPGVYGEAVLSLPAGITTVTLRAAPPDGDPVAFLQEGEPLLVLEPQQIIDGVLWRQVRLQNGQAGWLAGFLLNITRHR